jgi:uncharacterized protein
VIASLILAASVAASGAQNGQTAFLTFESGTLVAVNWVERQGHRLHTRSVLTQSRIIDAEITLRDDETAVEASTSVTEAGGNPGSPIQRSLGVGQIAWSDMMAPSSIESALRRAQLLDKERVRIPGTSLFRDTHDEVEVARQGPADWIVSCHDKRYEVITDASGRMLSATLPEYGVVIERREGFGPELYPLWAPHAAPPDGAYLAREVAIHAPQGHVLAGTLTTPRGRGRFPAAVLITGLSPNNRNEGDPPWMPLHDIADALTRHGIAVLRVDDRGVGASTGDRAPSTTFDEADDVRTEIAWLRERPEIDARRIALVGYSEGGLIAPMVASTDSALSAIVTLAGPGVPGIEVARYQIEADVVRDSTIRVTDRETAIQKELADSLTARERSYLGIDPLPYARRTRCPALIEQGATDLHVPLRSAEHLAQAMRDGGNRDVTVRIYPGVSHSLLPDPIGLNRGWVFLPAFLTSPEITRTTAEWLAARLGRTATRHEKVWPRR